MVTESNVSEIDRFIPEEYQGLIQVAKKEQTHVFIGELRIRGIFVHHGVTGAFGARALLEYAKHRKIIADHDLNEAVVKIIDKDCLFISFNNEGIEWLLMHNDHDTAARIFNKMSNQIFLPKSDIKTFVNVYLKFIKKVLSAEPIMAHIVPFLKKTIQDVKKIYARALAHDAVFYIKEEGISLDMEDANQSCLGYIYWLALIVYSSKIKDEMKREIIANIKTEANLLYWRKNLNQNLDVIEMIISSAKIRAESKDFTLP